MRSNYTLEFLKTYLNRLQPCLEIPSLHYPKPTTLRLSRGGSGHKTAFRTLSGIEAACYLFRSSKDNSVPTTSAKMRCTISIFIFLYQVKNKPDLAIATTHYANGEFGISQSEHLMRLIIFPS